jgi:hypothetical protein
MRKKFFRFLIQHIPNPWFISLILMFLGMLSHKDKNLKCKIILWLDEESKNTLKTIRCADKSISYSPEISGKKKIKGEVQIPAIKLHKLDDVIISARSSHIINNNYIYMERIKGVNDEAANYATSFVKEHNDTLAIVDDSIDEYLDCVFFLGGNGSWNYYHWMLEILPKIQYFLESNIVNNCFKILVSEKVKNVENYNVILKKAFENVNVDIIYICEKKHYKVSELYYISSPNNVLFNCRDDSFNYLYSFFRSESIHYIETLGNSLLESEDDLYNPLKCFYPNKIFLARKSNSLRGYNQNEVICLLNKFGFIAVYMEELTLVEQISHFKSAKMIVGPSGAAWTNLIFTNPKARAISWLPDNLSGFSVFSSIAGIKGVNMKFFITDSNGSKDYQGDYKVDLNVLESIITKELEEVI